VAPLLMLALPSLLLADAQRTAVLMGRASETFAAYLIEMHPELRDRVIATGSLHPYEAAKCMAACDVLLQPYEDGITARRSRGMAGLGLGVAVVSNLGRLSEPLWIEQPALYLADTRSEALSQREVAMELARTATVPLLDPEHRARTAAAGLALYRERFSLTRLIATLRAVEATP
jgi:hypothetical protein